MGPAGDDWRIQVRWILDEGRWVHIPTADVRGDNRNRKSLRAGRNCRGDSVTRRYIHRSNLDSIRPLVRTVGARLLKPSSPDPDSNPET